MDNNVRIIYTAFFKQPPDFMKNVRMHSNLGILLMKKAEDLKMISYLTKS
jgi:hypothetical protein